MKTFNALQIVILLMAAPSLLQLVHDASFAGAKAVFYVGIIGTLALSALAAFLVRNGMER